MGYQSPIAKQRMAEIARANAKLAGGADYVSPIVKENLAESSRIPVHNSGAGHPNFPPDITYNPTNRPIANSTRSATAAKNIAQGGGQKSAYNHR